MAQTLPTPDAKPKTDDQKLVPPDERFWQRYSPHGELPLSGASSLAIHLLIFGLMLLTAWLAYAVFSHTSRSLPVEAVRFGGGGGNPHGLNDGPNVGKPVEAGVTGDEKPPTPPIEDPIKRPELPTPNAAPQKQFHFDEDAKRVIQRSDSTGARAFERLNQANQRVRLPDKEPRDSGYGKGGKGSGGGSGDGQGKGTGKGRGDGTGTLTQREKRMLRWSMVFDTRSGRDYLSQLNGLGAILAVPVREQEGVAPEYKIIRDLSPGKAKLLDEDISKIQRIYWIDDKAQSVNDVMFILGVQVRPSHFVAFMPEELEQKLFKLEKDWLAKNHPGHTEDDIVETRFRIIHPKGGDYEPRVTEQKIK